jgi:hypothetical protein
MSGGPVARPLVGLWLLAVMPALALAQTPPGEGAWKPVATEDSVAIRYLFYSQADNVNNGLVLRLDNRGSARIAYRFIALFRSGEAQAEREVSGLLKAGESVTGDSDGLFFIPFPDGRTVEQIGLRGLRIRRLPPEH